MSEFDDCCPICYEAFNERDVSTTKCGHKFHTTCLLEASRHAQFNCPYCRQSMIANSNTSLHIPQGTYTPQEFLVFMQERNITMEQLEPQVRDMLTEYLDEAAKVNEYKKKQHADEERKKSVLKQNDPDRYKLFYSNKKK